MAPRALKEPRIPGLGSVFEPRPRLPLVHGTGKLVGDPLEVAACGLPIVQAAPPVRETGQELAAGMDPQGGEVRGLQRQHALEVVDPDPQEVAHPPGRVRASRLPATAAEEPGDGPVLDGDARAVSCESRRGAIGHRRRSDREWP